MAKSRSHIQPLFSEGSEEGGTPVDTDSLEALPLGEMDPPLSGIDHQTEPAPEIPEPDVPVPSESSDTTMTRAEMVAELNKILGTQGKRGLPTDVEFMRKGNSVWGHVIIDANDALIAEGWEFYKKHMPADSEEYLACVYDALQIGVPRLYRQVVKLRLT